jgi:hypothetical protein
LPLFFSTPSIQHTQELFGEIWLEEIKIRRIPLYCLQGRLPVREGALGSPRLSLAKGAGDSHVLMGVWWPSGSHWHDWVVHGGQCIKPGQMIAKMRT